MRQTKVRILLVDDHPVVRLGVRRYLDAHADLEVVAEAKDGNEALARYRGCQPDVVLMDVRMPGLTGLEATRALCCLHPEAAVIVLSAYGSEGDAERARAAGARAFLGKDAPPHELVSCLRSVVAGQPAFPRASAAPLTRRDIQFLGLLARGYSSREIARSTKLRLGTVNVYTSRLLARLAARTRSQAVAEAMRRGLITRAVRDDAAR